MSLDGRFTVGAALRRLLARFPALRRDPHLLRLSSSTSASVSDDEAAAALAEPFLHPSYTVAVLGCFLPIADRVVRRAVALLRSAAPSLRSESAASAEEEVGDGDVRVIEFYVSRGRGLRLHELASLALCRALDLAPHLLRHVLSYFKFSPPPFERLLSKGLPSPIPTKGLYLLVDSTRVSYRFLVMDPKLFAEQWDWSCFLDLVYNTEDLRVVDDTLGSVGLDLRWCAIQILTVVLKASDRAIESFGLGADEAFTCLLRWEEFCMDTSLEKASLYLQVGEENSTNCVDEPTCSPKVESLENNCLTDSLPDWQEIDERRKNGVVNTSSPFILTTTVRKSYEVASMAVSQRWPILLYGSVGAGKTALINKLAQVSGNQVLFIHMDEQMDSRTLIGSYICSEKPGEFKWAPGSLTQAIVKGFWIVFEDIDKAPSDVQSTLLPLLEGSSSFSTGHGEVVEVAESFRLFATITTSKHDISHALEGKLTFSALWRKVMVGAPNRKDMLDIINGCYPSLQSISSKLIDTFEKVNSLVSYQFGGLNVAGTVSDGILNRFSLRDLIKWCKRIRGVDLKFAGLGLVASDCKYIFHEALDIFSASLSSPEKRLLIAREIARIVGVPPQAETMQATDKPIIQARYMDLQVGRTTLQCTHKPTMKQDGPFADIRCALQVLERVACSVKFNEPVLLVGETGTGKTTLVQNLAMWLGQPLTVMNLSQQSDVSDLLGGFKPTDSRSICFPLYQEFKDLFHRSFSGKENEAILRHCDSFVMEKNWQKLLRALALCVEKVQKLIGGSAKSSSGSKRKRPLSAEVLSDWDSFSLRLKAAYSQIESTTSMSFKFVEGAFITALRNGHWILLDEVNLAPPETLQRISAVLDGERGTLCLAERGDVDYVERHSCFRMFACMNPATDAGKRDLPYSFRSRFTEYFVDDLLDDDDLHLFVSKYLDGLHGGHGVVDNIVRFYKAAKKESEEKLQDGANQKPQFSLRSLARALGYTKNAEKNFGFRKALYDGFCMFFLTMLDAPSAKVMNNMIVSYLLDGKVPPSISFVDYFTKKSKHQHAPESDEFLCSYVLTKSVTEHMVNVARAVYIKRYPVLLQGPTSSGKTSLVRYLASKTGHEFVRINNHEHTDLQEYFGTYITDSHGKLRFQEGVLVKAVREGHWIVLDELNLAPSDVLEALNRLLDDNRELFVPELQETIPAHPDFMLFATQNPPVLYGGRKMLSRAFRNRFLEVHVDDIPEDELVTILEHRCMIAHSYATKMVEVMKDLQLRRQNSRVFAGKHGFITPRDLFRWANRYRNFEGKSYEDLAKDGYLLLAERLRDGNERIVVKESLERRLRVKLNIDDLYKWETGHGDGLSQLARDPRVQESFGNITWTKSMWRLYFLVARCYKSCEPVLLIGETGGGKTTVCQVLSAVLGVKLHILNCHQYTETSDFIGGFCPIRDRSRLALEFKNIVANTKQLKIFIEVAGDAPLSFDISGAASTINQLNEIVDKYKKNKALFPEVSHQDLHAIEQIKLDLMQLHQRWETIFLWQDGPLVQAMKDGDFFLIDEISLADDSVLERLNSVLEPERKLSLAEKGGSVLEKITAHPNFFILATMNPGGDYGKKELSPALRNRFTEIWVPAVTDTEELKSIAIERFAKPELSCFADCIVNFWKWFNQLQTGRMLTIRDLLSWISFINMTEGNLGSQYALVHGLFLVLLDGLSLGTNISKADANKLRDTCLSFILDELQKSEGKSLDLELSKLENYGWGVNVTNTNKMLYKPVHSEDLFGINPFYIAKGQFACKQEGYEFLAPTTSRNVLRVLRAMQLPKPVLLEGSPGVGKTSLIVALAGFSGHNVVRINLSEQTDMMDLLGSDLPTQGDNGMEFSWSDGILLQALKNGSWVLLDELNLAPQSVLEGLNAILDHRAEVFIPELGQTFKCPRSFRVFACQNPSSQGGGRKGLPKSFLNRFTKVYVDELSADDYLFICRSRYPSIPIELLSKLISFNNRLYMDTMIYKKYGLDGSPWEFNLRDVVRSCEMIEGSPESSKVDCFLNTVYLQRMRTVADRIEVLKLFEEVFQIKPTLNQSKMIYINPQYLILGSACIQRNHFQPAKVWNNHLNILPGILHSLEAAMHCIQQGWLCILVGQHSSGKTSLIRLLAQLSGNTLKELNLSSATDVSELLGCFEQYNFFRHYKAVISQVEHYVDEYFSLGLDLNWKNLIAERKALFAKWFGFVVAKKCSSMPTSAFMQISRDKSFPSLRILADIVQQIKCDLEMFHLPLSWLTDGLSATLKSIDNLQQNKAIHQPVKFEWVAGDLVRAIECGEWVVLENANFCNPTVLDRINSLVEPERSIIINECGLVDGSPMVLNAHPQFRMFLTVNANYGEVSRAMRNRGVEIFLMDQDWTIDGCKKRCVDSERKDVTRFLISSGIPRSELVLSMSDAHMYAKAAGLRLGINITLLEVARWVQLFHQLLMKGNQFIWSLHLSWEHTYLPSLGEINGMETVKEGKLRFLTNFHCCKTDLLSGFSLSLPGGWPAAQKLRNFVWYSKESCVKRNCMYLQSLGAQSASYELSSSNGRISLLKNISNMQPLIIPSKILFEFMFPEYAAQHSFKTHDARALDLELVNRMLFIAANWVMEQATESDHELYVMWFKWYNSQLQPFCQFFGKFGTVLEQERAHPIWNSILECYKEIITHHKIDVTVHPIPLLSVKVLDMAASDSSLKVCRERLHNALPCVNLLRLTFHQWDTEISFPYQDKLVDNFLPALKSLRFLESEMLKVIMESAKLRQIYSSLLDYHRMIWKMIISSQFESLPVAWNFLRKEMMRLQCRFPVEVGVFLVENLNLNNLQDFNFQIQKPTLWVYGGHPFLPPSGAVFYKMQQLMASITAIWPRNNLLSQNLGDDQSVMHAMLLTNGELRRLAMEGVCMSSLVSSKIGEDDSKTVTQLDDFQQRLMGKIGSEKSNLELLFESPTIGVTPCCSLSLEILCRRYGFSSWLASLPLLNLKSFNLDIVLLQHLVKSTWLDSSETYQIITDVRHLLKYALDYSLELSSRSPLEFTQHQIIWWIQHAWDTVDSVHVRVASSLLEMWFNYHSSLWIYCSGTIKGWFSISYDEPCHLAHLTKMDAIQTILQDTICIRDYQMNCLKLRVASRNLWEGVLLPGNLVDSLRSSADSLFKQIIFVHKKHFKQEMFSKLESILFQLSENCLENEDLDVVRSLIATSTHEVLASLSESDTVIESLLKELYLTCTCDSLYNLGSTWLHIGELRFRLLLSSYTPDPASRSAFKHSHILEKISQLELEEKVRHECEELAGSNSAEDDPNERSLLLRDLDVEEKQMRAKVVFRPRPSRYKNLIAACCEFGDRLSDCQDLLTNLSCKGNVSLGVDRACSWQITSANFIKRLTEEYSEYIDLIQPVQVALYEMKLGLSIAVSGAIEREYLKKVKEQSIERVLDAIFICMQFLSASVAGRPPVDLPDITNLPVDQLETENNQVGDICLLKKLAAISCELSSDKVISHAQLLASVHHISLIRIAYLVCCSLIMDKASFMSLKETFDYFTSLWVDMKSRSKAKENDDSQYYKFRPRVIEIQDIFEGDVSPFLELDSEGNVACENEEKLEQEFLKTMKKPDKEDDNVEDVSNLIPESALKCVVLVHDQLFGSPNLVDEPGTFQISDEQKFQSFIESYGLGTRIMKDLPALISSRIDEKLMPEHLLRVCLEYERTCGISHNRTGCYNTYKNPNPSVMFKMVEPLIPLRDKVKYFLDEWPEHPSLQNILDIIESLLAMPLNTPLSKALLGLQVLVGKVQSLQENDSKFILKDHLHSIFALVSAWQRLELDCWPILLDEVQEQYEINAGNLWFPLRAILSHPCSTDSMNIDLSTIKSVEEFIQTSSVGEFKRRLHLLLAFYGELTGGTSVGAYSSTYLSKIQNVLYNVFGYYMQFMPLVLEKIEAGRGSIEKELKEQLKLYRWEQHPHCNTSVESFRRMRQKIFKLLQKFNDVLQQPVIVLLNQEVTGRKAPSWLDPKISDPVNIDAPQFPVDIMNLSSSERFVWYGDWRSKAFSALQTICNRSVATDDFLKSEVSADVIGQLLNRPAETDFKEEWENFWASLDRICRSAADVAHTLKHGTKNRKKRALSHLLKTLEGCGLSKHKPINHEQGDELDKPSMSFLQQSYDVAHLLQQVSIHKSTQDVSMFPPTLLNEFDNNKITNEWKHVNQQYFKCLAMMQQLQQISIKFNKDLGLEEVNRATSFMNHLMTVLSEQRFVAYGLHEKLKNFRHGFLLLGFEGETGFLSSRQNALLKCMWQQKRLFDNILAMARDMNLLLRSIKDCHLTSCNEVQVEAAAISAVIDKFIPRFLESKDLLDKYLLGSNNILVGAHKHMPLVTKKMEQLVALNAQLLNTFREDMQSSDFQVISMRPVKQVLLSRFEELLDKGKMTMEDFSTEVQESKCQVDSTLLQKLEASYAENYKETIELMINVIGTLGKLGLSNTLAQESSEGNITFWKDILQSFVTNLQMDHVCDVVDKTVSTLRKLVDYKPELNSYIEGHLKDLHMLLGAILYFAEGILSEFLDAHRTISEMTHALGDIFILLFSEGFGSVEETTEDAASGGTQDATGTGMGEGEGIKDVSDMIDDESQLLGTNEKDAQNKSDQVPNGKDKGIEMEDDFAGDMFDVSEDSGSEDSGDDEDMNLESQMGETGDKSQVVDEKAWDKNEDDNPQTSAEKYESGPSVKETDQRDRELRAKDDNALGAEEAAEMDNSEQTKDNELENEPSSCEDNDQNTNDIMNKTDAFENQTGAELQEPEKDPVDVNMDETEEPDIMDADNQDIGGSDEEMMDGDEDTNLPEHMEEENIMPPDDNSDVENEGEQIQDANVEPNNQTQEKDRTESLMHPSESLLTNQTQIDSNTETEANWANSSDVNSAIARSINFSSDEVPKLEVSMPDSGDGSRLSSNSKSEMQTDTPSLHIKQTNPFRSIGDAMEEWKERAKVSADTQDHQPEAEHDIDDENAAEYRYVPEGERSTSQALGAATSDQIKDDLKGKQSYSQDDSRVREMEEADERTHANDTSEVPHLKAAQSLVHRAEVGDQSQNKQVEANASVEEMQRDKHNNHLEDMVLFKCPFTDEKLVSSDAIMNDQEFSTLMDLDIADDEMQRAVVEWKSHELSTMRLSQELTEQLRLVMAPTLASKLQGDYRTGKRINMKKVIPYIASHFRRDKIWLRRTKPNKRNYQVVIAVDDSRSMSESQCGKVAVEALVTVCRAMSQLEVGQFAVASFGEKGNIKLLHDFDQAFTGEAGVRMISSLSFKQDNTIADQPVVDLLRHLNGMLDTAVARSRMPSGQNPLQQLILIIADGRFHEKENLRRYVRDVLNRKRMIAFILLDSPHESIMDLMEASFEGDKLSFTKYLNSFPFPYYVVLKNIEALPRTLADLLRQWFELMQSVNE